MKLHEIDILIICAYLIAMIVIGLILKKRAAQNMDSYFLGGKSLPFYMLGLSNASGMFDITGTMLMVYWAFAYGFKSLWIPWLWPVFNQIFLMVYLSVWLRRSNVLTGAEWIKTRFGKGKGSTLSHTIVIIFALLSVLGFLSYGFIGIGKFMEIFIPWEVVSPFIPFNVPAEYVPHVYGIFFTTIATFYVMLGGMLSIVWTDVVQFLIMTVAGIVIVVIGMQMVAPDMIHSFVPAGWDSPFFGWTLDIDWSSRMSLLTERMANEPYSLISIFVMMALLKGIFMSMAGPAPNYDMQKILSCKSPKEAAMMSGSVSVVLLIPRYLMIMGFALLAIYFFKEDGGLTQMEVTRTDFETILPHLITRYVPAGLAGILLAGLLAAFMSTFASTVNAAPAYIAANVLKWHWWRFNGEGYFWGMTAGVIAAIVMKFTVPDAWVLYFFPVLFGVSLIGCIAGTYSAPPTDEETLINFYTRVRPWGWWKPIEEKALARYPHIQPNRNFKRDAFNVAIGIVWQCSLTIIPMYLVVRQQLGLWSSIALLLVTTLILRKTWYKPLCKEEIRYNEEIKQLKQEKE